MMRAFRGFNCKFASPHSTYLRRLSDKINIAVLIDGDNATPRLFSKYIEEAAKHGKATVRRCYGDWSERGGGWKDDLNSFAIRPIQKFSYTTKKNSTDTALIIDAMDLLHSKTVQGFCIVSSDSDYTGLALRIREEGLFVMGIGEAHTARAFVNACEVFTCTDELEDVTHRRRLLDAQLDTTIVKPSFKNEQHLITIMLKIFDEKVVNESSGRVRLSTLGDCMIIKDSSFDIRKYGYASLSSFLHQQLPASHRMGNKDSSSFLERAGAMPQNYEVTDSVPAVPLAAAGANQKDIISMVFKVFRDSAAESGQIEIGLLHKLLALKYPSFNFKDYGCSNFTEFCQLLLPTYRVVRNPVKLGHVYLERVDLPKEGAAGVREGVADTDDDDYDILRDNEELLSNSYDWRREMRAQLDTAMKPCGISDFTTECFKNEQLFLVTIMLKIFDEKVVNESSGRVRLSTLGDCMMMKYSSFDIRKYGYVSLSSFLHQQLPASHRMGHKDSSSFLERVGAMPQNYEVTDFVPAVPLAAAGANQKDIISMVSKVFQKFADTNDRLEVGHLHMLLERNFPSFNVKDYGCSNFTEFCQLLSPTYSVVCDAESVYLIFCKLLND
jgi:uncharacterized LabA/DUF88 family protein